MNDSQVKDLREDISVIRSLTSSLLTHELFNRALEGQARMIIEKINKLEGQILSISEESKATKEAEVSELDRSNLKNPPTLTPSPFNTALPSTSFNPNESSDEVKKILEGLEKNSES